MSIVQELNAARNYLAPTPLVKQCFDFARERAVASGREYIGLSHLLRGMVDRCKGNDDGLDRVLSILGVSPEAFDQAVVAAFPESATIEDRPADQLAGASQR